MTLPPNAQTQCCYDALSRRCAENISPLETFGLLDSKYLECDLKHFKCCGGSGQYFDEKINAVRECSVNMFLRVSKEIINKASDDGVSFSEINKHCRRDQRVIDSKSGRKGYWLQL